LKSISPRSTVVEKDGSTVMIEFPKPGDTSVATGETGDASAPIGKPGDQSAPTGKQADTSAAVGVAEPHFSEK
jgi:hypothetical protein